MLASMDMTIAAILTLAVVLAHGAGLLWRREVKERQSEILELRDQVDFFRTALEEHGSAPASRRLIRLDGQGVLQISVPVAEIDRALLRDAADRLWEHLGDMNCDPDCLHDTQIAYRYEQIAAGVEIAAQGHYADGAAALYRAAELQIDDVQVSGVRALAKIAIHCAANEAATYPRSEP